MRNLNNVSILLIYKMFENFIKIYIIKNHFFLIHSFKIIKYLNKSVYFVLLLFIYIY